MADSQTQRALLYLIGHARVVFLGAILIVMLPYITASVLVNRGSLLLVQSLDRSGAAMGKYPHWQIEPKSNKTWQALRAFELAGRLDPSNFTALWGYGRAALASGMAEQAARVLPMNAACLRNPLCFVDVLVANSRAGDDDKVLELGSSAPGQITGRVISDSVALVSLNRARGTIKDGLEVASADLRQVVALRPFDLYANYYLWQHAIQRGDTEEAMNYYRGLMYFLSEAVTTDDERLLDYALDIFPQLLPASLWGPEGGRNLVSYWVWQYPESTELKHLLEELASRYPDQAVWRFYLGEIDHRLGNLDRAKQNYEIVLRLVPEDRLAQLRLDQLHQQSRLDRFTAVDALSQDAQVAAQLLGVADSGVRLGPNTLREDTFVASGSGAPKGWFYGAAGGAHNWQFAARRDSLERPGSLRFVNLWWPRDADSGYAPYADYHSAPFTVPTPWLLVSLSYKVEGKAGDHGFVYVGTLRTEGHAPFFVSAELPDTAGEWKRLVAVGPTPQADSELFLTIGDASAANVWFQDAVVRSVELTATPANCLLAACISLDNTRR